jgi:hypothetical protein
LEQKLSLFCKQCGSIIKKSGSAVSTSTIPQNSEHKDPDINQTVQPQMKPMTFTATPSASHAKIIPRTETKVAVTSSSNLLELMKREKDQKQQLGEAEKDNKEKLRISPNPSAPSSTNSSMYGTLGAQTKVGEFLKVRNFKFIQPSKGKRK